MNIGELENRVRLLAGDPNGLIYSEAQLVLWINDAIKECAVGNGLLQKTAASNMVVGTDTYVLPTDILKLHSVIVDSEKIKVYTFQEWEELNAGWGPSNP